MPSQFKNPVPGVHVLIDTQVVFGRPATHHDLVSALADFPVDALLVLLTNLHQYLDRFAVFADPRVQIPLLAKLGGQSSLVARIARSLAAEHSVFIFPEQLAALCKFTILHSTGTTWPLDASPRLINAMLAFNYLLGHEGEPLALGDIDGLVKLELRGVPNQDDRLENLIVRYQQFFQWAKSDAGKASVNYCSVDLDLIRFTGLTLTAYTAAAFSTLSFLQSIRTLEDAVSAKCPISLTAIRNGFRIPASVINWIEAHSTAIVDLRQNFAGESPTRYAAASMVALMSKPLIRLNEDQIVAPHRGFFENAVGSGLFFTLLDGYNVAGEPEQAQKFTRFFGEFFEQYALDIARRFAARSKSECFGEIEYVGKKSTDIAIFEGERAVFVEVVAKRFNILKSVIALDRDAIDNDLRAMVIDKAAQVDRCITDFRTGDLQYPGIDQKIVRKIFPVVLVVQPVSMGFGLKIKVDQALLERGLLQSVYPLEVMEIGTFESLEPVLGRDLKFSTVLNRKRVHKIGRRMSMKNHIFHNESGSLHSAMAKRREQSLIAVRRAEWFEEAICTVRSWGIAQ